ncbi:MAG: hypothetical protein Q8P08_00290, partial [bacterium]|nr:hypothetical protein [bacterium]
MAINGFVALVVSYFLWNFSLLAAGDAKLFTLYAFLIPQEFYVNAYFPVFPSFVLLVNVFIPLVLFLTFKSLLFGCRKALEKIRETGFSELVKGIRLKGFWARIFKFFRMYIVFVMIMVVIQLGREKALESFGNFDQNFSPIFLFLFLFFIYRFLFKFVAKSRLIGLLVIVLGAGLILYLVFGGQTAFLFNILKLALIFMVLVGFTLRILNFYIEQKEVSRMKVEGLEEGMFLGRQEIPQELQKKMGSVGRGGLGAEQLEIIKEFFKKSPEAEVRVYKTFALAPFIFLGALITILSRDSLV